MSSLCHWKEMFIGHISNMHWDQKQTVAGQTYLVTICSDYILRSIQTNLLVYNTTNIKTNTAGLICGVVLIKI